MISVCSFQNGNAQARAGGLGEFIGSAIEARGSLTLPINREGKGNERRL